VNQVFRLDGDSIILEGTHTATGALRTPCLNTDNYICPLGPPPQLVIQVQNARGANGSPLVAAVRNLSDNEFWDFNATDGSGRYPTQGFTPVVTSAGVAKLLSTAHWGSVIVITNSNPYECTDIPNVGPCIDLSKYPPLQIPAGVTIRGNRRGANAGP